MRVFVYDLLCAVPYYASAFCSALGKEGAEVVLGSTTYYQDRAHFHRTGLKPDPGLLDMVAHLPSRPAAGRRVLKLAEAMLNLAALAVRFSLRRPDIVHIQFLSLLLYRMPFELWLLGYARRLGSRIVYTVHDRLPHDTGSRYYQRYRRLYQSCDMLICHSGDAAQRLAAEFDVDPSRISVIPHGPLFAELKDMDSGAARRRLGLPENRPLVLFQGIVKPYKGVLFLLDAWAEVVRRIPDATLAIVGPGDPQVLDEIRRKVDELQLQDTVLLDSRFVPIEDVMAYYSAADVLVYPYREITTSGALLTGLARRKAIIATSLPPFRELLEDRRNALLVAYGDGCSMAEAICRLIQSPEERSRLAAAAGEVLDGAMSWQSIARRTMLVYEGLPGMSRRPTTA